LTGLDVQPGGDDGRSGVCGSDGFCMVELLGQFRDSPVQLVALLRRRLGDSEIVMARPIAMGA
jgi:hypothetical protein